MTIKLIRAASSGDIKQLRLELYEETTNINFQERFHGNTALHSALRGNHNAIAKILLRYGAKVNIRNKYGVTVFDICNDYHKKPNFIRIKK